MSVVSTSAFAQTPPGQPTSGPGGSDYPHRDVTAHGPFYPAGRTGDNNFRYFIYQPSSPKPESAPVILFLHGYGANYPEIYRPWMTHIARKGFTVVWVQYDRGFSSGRNFGTNAAESYRDALEKMSNDTTGMFVRPARNASNEILTGITGHSNGGYLSVVLAAMATQSGSRIPVPKVLVPVMAGQASSATGPYQNIPAETKVVFLVGADDTIACKGTTSALWRAIPQVPDENKEFLVLNSDTYGNPDLVSDHFVPVSRPNALDYYGVWKLSVAAFQCAFYGKECTTALGNGADQQVGMGQWSDGTPVKPMQWAASPSDVQLPCEIGSR